MSNFWLDDKVKQAVVQKGGWVNCHHHLCSAFSYDERWHERVLAGIGLEGKWDLSDELKRDAKYKRTLSLRMTHSISHMMSQGITACRAYINVDTIVGLVEMKQAVELKRILKGLGFYLQIVAYASRCILNPEEENILREALATFPEIECTGGVPSRGRRNVFDVETTQKVLSVLGALSLNYSKSLDVQIDQNDDPDEREILPLINTAEHLRDAGFKRNINATHLIALSAYRREDWPLRNKIIEKMAELDITVATCPVAARGMRVVKDKDAPLHKPIAPVRMLLDAGILVGAGTDNTSDLFEPAGRGDIDSEFNELLGSIRWPGGLYGEGSETLTFDDVIDIATTNGRKILEIDN